MSVFSEESMQKKLAELNVSQQSIQTTSLWLIHHKKHAQQVAQVWAAELYKVSNNRKLTFMYLANDVIQNSKKKGPEYREEFAKRFPKVFKHLGGVDLDEKTQKGVERLLSVWEQRGIFSKNSIGLFRREYAGRGSSEARGGTPGKRPSSSLDRPSVKRAKVSVSPTPPSDESSESGVDSEAGGDTPSLDPPSPPQPPARPERTPPDVDKLIAAIEVLENAATGDAPVREQISQLPQTVTDASVLDTLSDVAAGRALASTVEGAFSLLQDYNGRLAREMETRKGLAAMLSEAEVYNREMLEYNEAQSEDLRKKFAKVLKIKAELKTHLQNLPDISRHPQMSLPPLPSAGDLFTSN